MTVTVPDIPMAQVTSFESVGPPAAREPPGPGRPRQVAGRRGRPPRLGSSLMIIMMTVTTGRCQR